MASDFAMSQPAFVPQRREIWFTDGTSGFYALRVAASVWPQAAAASPAPAAGCQGRLRLRVKARVPHGAHVSSARATLAGKRAKIVRHGNSVYALVDTSRAPHRSVRLLIRVRLTGGHTAVTDNVYDSCTGRLRHTLRAPHKEARTHHSPAFAG